MTYQWKTDAHHSALYADDRLLCTLPAQAGCTDTFEAIGEGAWRWVRKCETPVTEMKLTLRQANPVTYWQVPAVNYNGNGWGSGAQYFGYGCDGEPWTYAWHRIAIPACTYAEQHPDEIAGVVLLGAYVYGGLPAEKTLVLYGEHDLVLSREKLSGGANEILLPGGNHAGFGNYGPQQGDGEATVSAAEQQAAAVRHALEFMGLAG